MAFRVDISPAALADAEEAYLWRQQNIPERADEWFNGLLQAVFSLENFPIRCALAPISDAFERKVRQLLYGKGRGAYRILFTITEETVVVLRILHSARDIDSEF